MFKEIYEYGAILDGTRKMSAAASAGLVVMLDEDNAGYVKASDGSAAWGILAQDVITYTAGDYRKLVTSDAAAGEVVGVYHGNAIFETDNYVAAASSGTAYKPGQTLYVTTAGKLTNATDEAASATAGVVPVGIVIEEGSGVLTYQLALPMIYVEGAGEGE